MKRCMIYLDEQAPLDSIGLLDAAGRIHAGEAFEAIGVTCGDVTETASRAFDTVIRIVHPELRLFDPMAVTEAMVELQADRRCDSILIPATPFGRMLAPRLAMRLDTGLVADVTAISREGQELLAIRPAYSGRLLASIRFAGAGPVMMSIRPGAFH